MFAVRKFGSGESEVGRQERKEPWVISLRFTDPAVEKEGENKEERGMSIEDNTLNTDDAPKGRIQVEGGVERTRAEGGEWKRERRRLEGKNMDKDG